MTIKQPYWHELMCEAVHCRRRGNHALAVGKLLQSIDLAKRIPGLADEVASNLNFLADTYLQLGMLLEAEASAREAMQTEFAVSVPTFVADNLMILAKIQHRQGKTVEAVQYGKQALTIYRKCLGWRNEVVRSTKVEVASFAKAPAEIDKKLGEAA